MPGTDPYAGSVTAVLLAEDDEAIAAPPLSRALGREGYEVTVAQEGPSALEQALSGRYELLILDLGLPGMDGLEVCRQIRSNRSDLAVLMLTARTDEVDFVVGLDAGADDYVGKPFRLAELMARVRALLRRRGSGETDEVIEVAGIRLERAARRVLVDGSEVTLANKEFELLRVLLEHAGRWSPGTRSCRRCGGRRRPARFQDPRHAHVLAAPEDRRRGPPLGGNAASRPSVVSVSA